MSLFMTILLKARSMQPTLRTRYREATMATQEEVLWPELRLMRYWRKRRRRLVPLHLAFEASIFAWSSRKKFVYYEYVVWLYPASYVISQFQKFDRKTEKTWEHDVSPQFHGSSWQQSKLVLLWVFRISYKQSIHICKSIWSYNPACLVTLSLII